MPVEGLIGTLMILDRAPKGRNERLRWILCAVRRIREADQNRMIVVSDGGEIFMPMQETFFAFRFAMLRDRFGTSWMIINERPLPQSA